jgi:hypothetical protein
MGSIKVEDLNNEPISFDLTESDLIAIQGGTTAPTSLYIGKKCPFPILIYVIIIIKAPPIDFDFDIV